jgi:hypothetical protein
MKPQDFYTRKRANEGIRVYLRDGDGNNTDAWLLVRGVDSDAYRAANDTVQSTMVRLASAVRAKSDAPLLEATKEETDAAIMASRVALVADWNLEGECTPAAVEELFREAPYISDQVHVAAHNRDRFLGSCSTTSTAGPNTDSASTSQQPQEQVTP